VELNCRHARFRLAVQQDCHRGAHAGNEDGADGENLSGFWVSQKHEGCGRIFREGKLKQSVFHRSFTNAKTLLSTLLEQKPQSRT
jgi:hypothetical protein